MFFVYIVQNERDELYCGYSNNIERRLAEHNRGSTHTTRGSMWSVVYYEAYRAEHDAREREKQLKFRGQAKTQLKRRISQSLQRKT
ncbi:MAG: hypothetical protein COV91_06135 [Candidatus Taylorbacteria bacterium CG11_big_fil_rev_8_21_14_0_20_46_11]|uniref:GIY-YIG domain-containing protein n=1 Tax=Candidatus Taylorbacteria bacterium CG11_big_fil_rev_8_21_14_0_20_46_11 TaxID=1975025 RepID=A0A2H0KA15_9BACT|nr:MAG: hypothetical protein COV91_06135 [Candidatus Taylorbacteria bacterium CG11_big_fil_rev_8_21_14_0_20_46_11]